MPIVESHVRRRRHQTKPTTATIEANTTADQLPAPSPTMAPATPSEPRNDGPQHTPNAATPAANADSGPRARPDALRLARDVLSGCSVSVNNGVLMEVGDALSTDNATVNPDPYSKVKR